MPYRRRGFTLIELLIVISVIGVLLGLLLPALGAARDAAMTVKCLSNMRNMEMAHWMYMTDHDGRLINAGLGAGGHNPADSWVNTLNEYYGSELLHRSPVDDSMYWATPGAGGELRRTSYGVNNYLVPPTSSGIPSSATRLEQVRNPSATVHFLYMSESNPTHAVADHPHVEQWPTDALFHPNGMPGAAANQLETNAHGGPQASWESISNYGFLDGHAQTAAFSEVYATDESWNCFDPAATR